MLIVVLNRTTSIEDTTLAIDTLETASQMIVEVGDGVTQEDIIHEHIHIIVLQFLILHLLYLSPRSRSRLHATACYH